MDIVSSNVDIGVDIRYSPNINCSVCGTKTVKLNYYTDICYTNKVGVNDKVCNGKLRVCPKCGTVKVVPDEEYTWRM